MPTFRLLSLPLVLGVSLAAAAPPSRGKPEPSESCGQCHRTIYETWSASAHARSLDKPFLDTLQELKAVGDRGRLRVCLKCHAPIIDINGDEKLEYRVTWEGVSCDVCHNLVAVDLSGLGPRQVLEPGPVKRGPVADAPATGHPVAYSELHTTSLVCAGCHEYVNPEGIPILTTYSEWMKSRAASEGKTCQTCHMGAAEAGADDPRAERQPGASINLHRVPGGHVLEQLHRALAVTIEPWREGSELVVEVRIRNRGAGHAVPTGMPGRRVVLDLEVQTSAGAAFEDRRTYGKFFVEAGGRRVDRDSGYFASGVRLESDSRIQPDERRAEVFRFPLERNVAAYVTARLHYEHAPLGTEEGRTWLTFLSEKRAVVPESAAPPPEGVP